MLLLVAAFLVTDALVLQILLEGSVAKWQAPCICEMNLDLLVQMYKCSTKILLKGFVHEACKKVHGSACTIP